MEWFGSRRAAPTEILVLALMMLAALLVAASARAAGAGYWHTSGNRILDSANQPVRIASINWYGFETTTFVAHGLWINDYKAILNLIKSSGFNTVRIPYSDQMMSQNPVLGTMNINRNGINTDIAADARALDVLDKIIAHCGTIGLRVILDNHRSNAGNSAQESGLWFTSEFPESTWLANWRALTTRYNGNTTVIGMDLRNEPHNSACWGGDPAGCSSANDWHAAATRAGNAILAINPNLLIFVEGNDRYNNSFTWWGGMLRGVASRPVTPQRRQPRGVFGARLRSGRGQPVMVQRQHHGRVAGRRVGPELGLHPQPEHSRRSTSARWARSMATPTSRARRPARRASGSRAWCSTSTASRRWAGPTGP